MESESGSGYGGLAAMIIDPFEMAAEFSLEIPVTSK